MVMANIDGGDILMTTITATGEPDLGDLTTTMTMGMAIGTGTTPGVLATEGEVVMLTCQWQMTIQTLQTSFLKEEARSR